MWIWLHDWYERTGWLLSGACRNCGVGMTHYKDGEPVESCATWDRLCCGCDPYKRFDKRAINNWLDTTTQD